LRGEARALHARGLTLRRAACTIAGVNTVILIAGVLGLAVAGYGLLALSVDAWRRRQYADLALAPGVALVVVLVLLFYGDRLLR